MVEYNPFAEFKSQGFMSLDPLTRFTRFTQVFGQLPEYGAEDTDVREQIRNKVLGFKSTQELYGAINAELGKNQADPETRQRVFNEFARDFGEYARWEMPEKLKLRQAFVGQVEARPDAGIGGTPAPLSGLPAGEILPIRPMVPETDRQQVGMNVSAGEIARRQQAAQQQAAQEQYLAEQEFRGSLPGPLRAAAHVIAGAPQDPSAPPGEQAYGGIPVLRELAVPFMRTVARTPGEVSENVALAAVTGEEAQREFSSAADRLKGVRQQAEGLPETPDVAAMREQGRAALENQQRIDERAQVLAEIEEWDRREKQRVLQEIQAGGEVTPPRQAPKALYDALQTPLKLEEQKKLLYQSDDMLELAKQASEFSNEWAEYIEAAPAPKVGRIEDATSTFGVVNYGLSAIGDMAGFMAKTALGAAVARKIGVSPSAGGFAAMLIPSIADISMEIKNSTGGELRPELAIPAGTAVAMMERAGLEYLGSKLTQPVRHKLYTKFVGRLVAAIETGGVEALTEMAQELISIDVARLGLSDEERGALEGLTIEERSRLINAALAGFIGGAGMSSAGGAYREYMRRASPAEQAAAEETLAKLHETLGEGGAAKVEELVIRLAVQGGPDLSVKPSEAKARVEETLGAPSPTAEERATAEEEYAARTRETPGRREQDVSAAESAERQYIERNPALLELVTTATSEEVAAQLNVPIEEADRMVRMFQQAEPAVAEGTEGEAQAQQQEEAPSILVDASGRPLRAEPVEPASPQPGGRQRTDVDESVEYLQENQYPEAAAALQKLNVGDDMTPDDYSALNRLWDEIEQGKVIPDVGEVITRLRQETAEPGARVLRREAAQRVFFAVTQDGAETVAEVVERTGMPEAEVRRHLKDLLASETLEERPFGGVQQPARYTAPGGKTKTEAEEAGRRIETPEDLERWITEHVQSQNMGIGELYDKLQQENQYTGTKQQLAASLRRMTTDEKLTRAKEGGGSVYSPGPTRGQKAQQEAEILGRLKEPIETNAGRLAPGDTFNMPSMQIENAVVTGVEMGERGQRSIRYVPQTPEVQAAQDQLEVLDKRLGKGVGAKRERAKLNARIEAASETAVVGPRTKAQVTETSQERITELYPEEPTRQARPAAKQAPAQQAAEKRGGWQREMIDRYERRLDLAENAEEVNAVVEMWENEPRKPGLFNIARAAAIRKRVLKSVGREERAAPKEAAAAKETPAAAPGTVLYGPDNLPIQERREPSRPFQDVTLEEEQRAEVRKHLERLGDKATKDEIAAELGNHIAALIGEAEMDPKGTGLAMGGSETNNRLRRQFTKDDDLVVIDMDNLKFANNRGKATGLGENLGNAALKAVADAMLKVAPGRSFRWGGDEFVIRAPKGKGPAMIRKLRANIQKTIKMAGHALPVNVSAGVGKADSLKEAYDAGKKEMEKNKAHRTRAGHRVEREETPSGYLYKDKVLDDAKTTEPEPEPQPKRRKKPAEKKAAKAVEEKVELTDDEQSVLDALDDGHDTATKIFEATAIPRGTVRKAFHSLAKKGLVTLERQKKEDGTVRFVATLVETGEEAAAKEQYKEQQKEFREAEKAEKEEVKSKEKTVAQRLKEAYEASETPVADERAGRDRTAEKGSWTILPEAQDKNDTETLEAKSKWARSKSDYLMRGGRRLTNQETGKATWRGTMSLGMREAWANMLGVKEGFFKEAASDFKRLSDAIDSITRNKEERARIGPVLSAYMNGAISKEEVAGILGEKRVPEHVFGLLDVAREKNMERQKLVQQLSTLPEEVRQHLLSQEFYFRRAYQRFLQNRSILGRWGRYKPTEADKVEAVDIIADTYAKEVQNLARRLHELQKEIPDGFDFVGFFNSYENDALQGVDAVVADKLIGLRNQIQAMSKGLEIIESITGDRVGITERADGLRDMAERAVQTMLTDPYIKGQRGHQINTSNLQPRVLTEVFRRLYGEIEDPAILQALTVEAQGTVLAQAAFFEEMMRNGKGLVWADGKDDVDGLNAQLGSYDKEGKINQSDVFKYGKLAGKFVSPEFKDFLELKGLTQIGIRELFDIGAMRPRSFAAKFADTLTKAQAITRTMALTSVGAYVRNYMSSYLQFSMQSGDFFRGRFQKKFFSYTKLAWDIWMEKADALQTLSDDMKKGAFRYQSASIVSDMTPILSEITSSSRLDISKGKHAFLKATDNGKKLAKKVQEMYVLIDYAAKKAAYETRFEIAKEKGKSDAVANQYAKEHVSKFYQNAEKVPEAIQVVSRFGLQDFAGFKWDSGRMAINAVVNAYVATNAREASPEGSWLAEWKGVLNEHPDLIDTWQPASGVLAGRLAGIGLYGPGQYLFMFGPTAKLASMAGAALMQSLGFDDDEAEVENLPEEVSAAMNQILPVYDANSPRWEYLKEDKDGKKSIMIWALGNQFGNVAEESLIGLIQRMAVGGESPAEILEHMARPENIAGGLIPMGMMFSNIYEALTGYDPQTQTTGKSLTGAFKAFGEGNYDDMTDQAKGAMLDLMADTMGAFGRGWKEYSKREKRAGRKPTAGTYFQEFGDDPLEMMYETVKPIVRVLRGREFDAEEMKRTLPYRFQKEVARITSAKYREGTEARGIQDLGAATDDDIAVTKAGREKRLNTLNDLAAQIQRIKPATDYIGLSEEDVVGLFVSKRTGDGMLSRKEAEAVVYNRVEAYLNSDDAWKPEPRLSPDQEGDTAMRTMLTENPYTPASDLYGALKNEGFQVPAYDKFVDRYKKFREELAKRQNQTGY